MQSCDDYPTHQPVQIKIASAKVAVVCRKLRKTESAVEAVAKKVEEATATKTEAEKVQTRIQFNAQLHGMMDKHLAEREQRLNDAQAAKDTTTMWKLISASIEAAFIQFLELDKREAKKMRGRGVVTI